MSVLVDKNTRLIVQGITGRERLFRSNDAATTAPKSLVVSALGKVAIQRADEN